MLLLEDVMQKLDDIGHKLDRLNDSLKKMRVTVASADERLERLGNVLNAGYVLTEPEIAEVLARSERDTTAHTSLHVVQRGRDAIVFGANMRELPTGIPADGDFPLLSTCVCGRQICCTTKGAGWEYCGA